MPSSHEPRLPFSRVRSLAYGASLPFRAARLILRTPELLALSALPVAIALALYAFVISRAQAAAQAWVMHAIAARGWNTQGFLVHLVQLGLVFGLFVAGAFTFSLVTGIIAAPFSDWLAERTEPHASPPLARMPSPTLGRRLKIILIDISKSGVSALAAIAAIGLAWVPVLNVLAAALACLLVTFQYVSYPQTRRGLGIGHGFRFVVRHLFASAGFGATVSALFAMPLLSVLALPLAVVGGTLLVARAQLATEELR